MSQGEKPAYQDRSRRTREKIVRALDAALKEKPFDQVSVAEIAQRANVAVGTVYRRFENKDALIPVILEIYKDQLDRWAAGEGALEVNPDDDLRSVLRKIMRKAWDILNQQAHLLRAVHLYVRLKPHLADDDFWRDYETAAYDSMAMVLGHFSGQINRKDIKRASAMTAYIYNTVFLEKALYPDESPANGLKYSGKTLADEVAEMIYGYLQLPEK